MVSRYEATLNSVDLTSLSDKILILDIAHSDPGITLGTYSTAGRDGAHVYRKYKEKASVTISFEVREYNTIERQNILHNIVAWARDGGMLETSDREEQYLMVECERLPYIGSVMRWTDTMTVTFSAYSVPYWQSSGVTALTLTGIQANGNLILPGNAPQTVITAVITAAAPMTYISLECGQTKLSLRNMSIPTDGKIALDYTDDMMLQIKTGNTSLLSKRTGSDDLIAICGANNRVGFSSDAQCTVEFRGRGLWQ